MTDWIQTFTGKKFYPLDPTTSAICIEDIAHALSLTNRFGGHSREAYNVADHSIRVMRLVPDYLKLAALLHDAAEAYLCDLPSPVKRHKDMAAYRHAEEMLMLHIGIKFGVPPRLWAEVKAADIEMFSIEAWSLFPPERVKEWAYALPDTGERITPKSATESEVEFLMLYDKLIGI